MIGDTDDQPQPECSYVPQGTVQPQCTDDNYDPSKDERGMLWVFKCTEGEWPDAVYNDVTNLPLAKRGRGSTEWPP